MSRIVTPVSRHDIHRLPDWIEVVEFLRAGLQHDLHVVIPQNLESELIDPEKGDYKARLEEQFHSVTVHLIEIEPTGGWPKAPNAFFWHAANFMARNPTIPFMICELDCFPLRINSFDALASQYQSNGNPFFGNINATPWREDEYIEGAKGDLVPNPRAGKIAFSPMGKDDKMMSGCAMYPGDIMLRPTFNGKNSSGLMSDFVKGNESIDQPWDMHLRGAMKAEGMGHTDLIANHWNTVNYRIQDGHIVCDSGEEHEAQRPDWEVRKCGGTVHPAAMFIHGCQDNSLKNLILNDEIPEFIVPRRANVPQKDAPPAQPSKVELLEKKVDGLTSLMEAFLKAQTAQKPQTISEPAPTPKPPVIAQKCEIDTILGFIPDEKNIRLDILAAKMGLDGSKVEEVVKANPDKLILSGKMKWIKRTTVSV